MAQIVGGVGVPHTPHFPGIVDRGDPPAREISRLYGEVAEVLRDLAPDVLIFLTCDHYTNFFVESVPIFSVGVAESARGPSDYLELPRCEAMIDAPLARRIQAHAVTNGFDVGMSQEFDLDHPVTVPLHFLTPAMDVPVVPVFISGLMPPLPPAWRCRALGAVIADAVGHVERPLRVAAVASGSFSLEIGGPRLSPHSHTGIPDPGWTDRVLELLAAADLDRLVSEATAKQLTQAGNAAGELLTWITMLGMFDPCRPAFLGAQREFGHAYGAWRAA